MSGMFIIWALSRENLSVQSDQRFVIRFVESIICKLATGEISIF